MSKWPIAEFGEIIADGPTNGYSGRTAPDATGSPTLRLSATTSGAMVLNSSTTKRLNEVISPTSDLWLRPDDLLVQRSNTLDLVGTAAVYRGPPGAFVYPDLMMRIRLQPKIEVRFVCRYLNSPAGRAALRRIASGSAGSMPKISGARLRRLPIPVPPQSEQRRIADILDKADALRAKRGAALAQLDTLTQSIFFDMFGDPTSNPKNWVLEPFSRFLAAPLRNGLSPSKAGRVFAKVLTLSAITGDSFSPESLKTSTFHVVPPLEQSVHELDLLICRGNGNLNLVGKGYFPSSSMPEVTFPDTMIAARVDRELIDPIFLEHVWNSGLVRRQIESAARTTNGTLKVNQSMLEAIRVLSPPLPIQREFSERISEVKNMSTKQRQALSAIDVLFASLQHRAFRGEL